MESKKIFVGGLAPTVTEQAFRAYFEKFGRLVDAVVMMDRNTQRSRGFGFVTFEAEVRQGRERLQSHCFACPAVRFYDFASMLFVVAHVDVLYFSLSSLTASSKGRAQRNPRTRWESSGGEEGTT